MTKNIKLVMALGLLALIAIFILIAFSRSALQNSLDETYDKYNQQPITAQGIITTPGPFGEQGDDALVTKGVLVPPIRQGDPINGSRYARLFIIEFGDFACQYCVDMAGTLKQMVANLPTVSVVWKDLANPLHAEASNAALAARCAQAQDKFWEYHDLLFLNQELLGTEIYTELAQILELDIPSFQTCLDNQVFIEVVGQGMEDANNYSVDGTPYLFVGSQRVNQLVSYEQLVELVEAELTRINELDN